MVGKSRYCEICGVREIFRGGFFAKFPKDELRCKTWLRLVGKEDLIHVPIEKLHELRHVCGDHFDRRDFGKTGNKLKKRAYPKLNLAAPPLTDHQLRGFPQHVASRRGNFLLVNIFINYPLKQWIVQDVLRDHNYFKHNDDEEDTSTKAQTPVFDTATSATTIRADLQSTCLRIQPDKVQDVLRDHNYFKHNDDEEDTSTKAQTPVFDTATSATTIRADLQSTCLRIQPDKELVKMFTDMSPRKKKLVERLKKTRCTLASLRKSATVIENIESPALKEIIINASKNQSRKPTGRRWTTKNKISCLAILKRSAKTYRYLRHIIPLPSVKTLQNVLKKIPMEPGLNKSVLDHLVMAGQHKNEKEKVCALLFDEIALKPRLLYNSSTGNVEGFRDFGSTERSSDIADHALVFMLQGIYRKFKQPIAFYFVKGTISTEKLSVLIKEIITAVNATGHKVLATVCDQGPTNMGAIKLLKKFSVPSSVLQNSFFLDGEEIFTLYDIPHLFKSLRNNFLNNGVLSWNGKKAKWSHLRLVEEKNRNFLYLSKVSPVHVFPKYRAKMRVKYAAQMLSNTVAAVLKLLSQAERDERQAAELLETAEVVQELDRLFDFTNGPSSAEDIKKGLRQNVSQKTTHLEEWAALEGKLKTAKFLNTFGTVATNVKCIQGYLMSLQSLRGIWLKTRAMGFKYLNLRQLNQDSLENLFGVIRQQSPTNSNPTCTHFMAALKTAVVTGLTAPHSAGSNCQKDRNMLLTDFHNLVFGSHESKPSSSENPQSTENPQASIDAENGDDLSDEEIPVLSLPEGPETNEIEEELVSIENQSVVYVSGYLASRITKVHECDQCRNTLTVTPDLDDIKNDDTYSYIRLREWWGEKQSLTYPSKNLCCLVKRATEIMETDICTSLHRIDVFVYAVTLFNTGCDTTWFDCALHKTFVFDNIFSTMAHLFIRRQCQRLNQSLASREEALSDAIKMAQQQGKAK
ncbi:uncharacterized protein LOC134661987 [Cydia amplana]|uniref:uncharacterized protein LOC134661987 n=1 Tax=Cydia amplana TaxID=1869771 RepID=UPI002FE5B56B